MHNFLWPETLVGHTLLKARLCASGEFMKNLARAVVFASLISMSASAFAGVSGTNPRPPAGSIHFSDVVSAVMTALGY